ncbi:alpha/beta hydrolase [bacterium]|nr:alpha/beta hydrolase [bacterium]
MPAINIDGIKINYMDSGRGMPLVFVPGLAGSKEWFSYQASGLSDHFRIVSYDLRRASGHVDYSLDLLVDDLFRFLKALRIYGAVIVGHSLGGLIAMCFALNHPEYCPALVLCSTTPTFPSESIDELGAFVLVGKAESEGFFAKMWRRLFGSKAEQEEPGGISTEMARLAGRLDHATLAHRLNILRKTDLRPILPQIAIPTLIVASTGDQPYVLAGSQLMDESIPESTLEVIENDDEFYFYTRHDIFNDILIDYVSEKIARF